MCIVSKVDTLGLIVNYQSKLNPPVRSRRRAIKHYRVDRGWCRDRSHATEVAVLYRRWGSWLAIQPSLNFRGRFIGSCSSIRSTLLAQASFWVALFTRVLFWIVYNSRTHNTAFGIWIWIPRCPTLLHYALPTGIALHHRFNYSATLHKLFVFAASGACATAPQLR